MQEALNDLESSEILNREQVALLRRIYGRELFSVHWELRRLLYGGILILTTGLGLLIAKHFASIGHLALLATIALGCAGCFAYCLRHGGGFSPRGCAAPDAAYDYVLLLGCLLLGSLSGLSGTPLPGPGPVLELVAARFRPDLPPLRPLLRQPPGPLPGPLHPRRLARRQDEPARPGGSGKAPCATTPSASAPWWWPPGRLRPGSAGNATSSPSICTSASTSSSPPWSPGSAPGADGPAYLAGLLLVGSGECPLCPARTQLRLSPLRRPLRLSRHHHLRARSRSLGQ